MVFVLVFRMGPAVGVWAHADGGESPRICAMTGQRSESFEGARSSK